MLIGSKCSAEFKIVKLAIISRSYLLVRTSNITSWIKLSIDSNEFYTNQLSLRDNLVRDQTDLIRTKYIRECTRNVLRALLSNYYFSY